MLCAVDNVEHQYLFDEMHKNLPLFMMPDFNGVVNGKATSYGNAIFNASNP